MPSNIAAFIVFLFYHLSVCVCAQEMPGDIDYINLGRMIVPLELNYCQCMLELEEYYEVIEHTDELLEKHKGTFARLDYLILIIGPEICL